MKKVVLGILVVIVLIQFIRPEKNNSKDWSNDYTNELNVPEEIQKIIKTSCADCHSNYTKYPWYSEVAPVSWYLAQHVNDGKKHLNFSEWTAYNSNQKKHILKDLKEVLQSHEMPLESYLILHKEAELSKDQYELFQNWVKTIVIE
jgi:hypothetical protein